MSVVSSDVLTRDNGRTVLAGIVAFAVAAVSLLLAPGVEGLFGAMLGLIVVAVADIDARERIIPDALNAGAVVLALLRAGLIGAEAGLWNLGDALLRGAVAAGTLWVVREVHKRARGVEGLGLGDVKLAAVIGMWLDWMTIVIVIEVAAISAIAFYSCTRLIRRRAMDANTELPFGLFLAPALWLGWVYQTVF